ncbi:hypothetical protein [Helicobacter pylori]|nr:hypothetical protein [Helicobacter pylori]MDO7813832.1 hypothetical protein [Helicobacter pylori]
MKYRPLLALLKGFYYTIRDIANDQAVLEEFILQELILPCVISNTRQVW